MMPSTSLTIRLLDGFDDPRPGAGGRAARRASPELDRVTHPGEMHPDHRAAARLVRPFAARPGGPDGAPLIRMDEVWTPLPRMGDVIDVPDRIDVEPDAIRAHQGRSDVLRFEEGARGPGRCRGEMRRRSGGDDAEVFPRTQA